MNGPSLIQALFAGFFGIFILRLFLQAFRGHIPRNRAIIWIAIWGTGLTLVLVPSLSFHLASILGVKRGTDAVTYSAIALLSWLVFRSFYLIDSLDGDLSRLTTELAIQQWEARQLHPTPLQTNENDSLDAHKPTSQLDQASPQAPQQNPLL